MKTRACEECVAHFATAPAGPPAAQLLRQRSTDKRSRAQTATRRPKASQSSAGMDQSTVAVRRQTGRRRECTRDKCGRVRSALARVHENWPRDECEREAAASNKR